MKSRAYGKCSSLLWYRDDADGGDISAALNPNVDPAAHRDTASRSQLGHSTSGHNFVNRTGTVIFKTKTHKGVHFFPVIAK